MRDPKLFILNPYYGLYLGINNIFYSYNINKLCSYISNWGIELNIYIRVIINPINYKVTAMLLSNIKSISNNNISPLFNITNPLPAEAEGYGRSMVDGYRL